MKPRVLVVDDEDTIRKLLKSRLERDGQDVIVVNDAEAAQKEVEKDPRIGVLITDLKMPGKDGFELMRDVRETHKSVRVIVITGHGEKAAAVQALRYGAADYLEKPFDMDELSHAVQRAIRENLLERDNEELVDRMEARLDRVEGKKEDETWYVSKSRSMEKVNEWLTILRRESLRGDAEEPSVLLLGESGTGKEGIARMVHAGSRRARGPWVAVNCANFNEQLLESELFGHERGAFTGANSLKRGLFEIAKGGTLFLDEIGEMDVKLQAKLLRVLQERIFRRVGGTADLDSDVRVVAATNRNLKDRVSNGDFREDLYHRLCRVVIEIPALRDRTEDILPMAKHFANRAFNSRGKTFGGFTPDAEAAIRDNPWNGNVRELLNVIERVSLVWQGNGTVSEKDLNLPRVSSVTAAELGGGQLASVANPFQSPENSGVNGFMELKKKWCNSFEREYLINALVRHSGNVSAAAREAELDRSNFLRLLRRHGLKAQEYRKAA